MNRKILANVKQINLNADGTPPPEFKIWAFGENVTTKGTFLLTEESAAKVMAEATDWGNKYSLDYNHAMPIHDAPSPEQGIAAAWFDLELRADGIWAANVEWTARATEYLQAKEYKYFSPWWLANELNEIVQFINAALTNIPATKHMDPLVASQDLNPGARAVKDHREPSVIASLSLTNIEMQLRSLLKSKFQAPTDYVWMVEAWVDHVIFEMDSQPGVIFRIEYSVQNDIVSLTSDAVQVRREYNPIPGGTTMKTVLAALKLTDASTEAEALERVTGITASNQQLLSATGETDVNKALGVIAGWKAGHEQAHALNAKLEKLEGERKSERLNALIATGKAEGKVTPAMEPVMASWSVEQTESFLAVAPKAIPVGENTQEPTHQSADGQGVLLTYKGQTWADMKPIDKANLHQTDNTMYIAMRDQAQAN